MNIQPLEQLHKPGFWDTARFRMKQLSGWRQPGMEDQPLNTWEKIGGLLQQYRQPDQESPYHAGMPKTSYSTPPFVEPGRQVSPAVRRGAAMYELPSLDEQIGQGKFKRGLDDILGALQRFR